MLAHELVHARSGSTQPRFFGGRQNAEERQADQVGAFAARMIAHGSPPLRPERDASSWTPLPSSRSATLRRRLTDPVRSVAGARPGTEGLPVGGVAGLFGAGTGTKSGSGASGGSGVTDSGSGSVSANVLAGGQAGPLELLRRSVGGAPQSPPLPAPAPASGWSAETASFGASSRAGGGFGPNVGRSGNDVSRSGDSSVLQRRAAQPAQSPAQTTESHGEADRSTTNLLDNVDALLETLEERIIAQLERRGLRLGGIF